MKITKFPTSQVKVSRCRSVEVYTHCTVVRSIDVYGANRHHWLGLIIIFLWHEPMTIILSCIELFIFRSEYTSNTYIYVTPRMRTKFGERVFSHAGPTVWNSLPVDIRAETSQVKFKKLLKIHFFNLAFPGWLRVLFSWFVVYAILCLVMRLFFQ